MILFKESERRRLEREFEEDISSRLRVVLFALEGYLKWTQNTPLLIVHLVRTQEEQDAIYTSDKIPKEVREKYIKHPHYSVHQKICGCRGADIGIADIKEPEKVKEWLNANIRYDGWNRYKTAIMHDIGHGHHIHIQTAPCKKTTILEVNEKFTPSIGIKAIEKDTQKEREDAERKYKAFKKVAPIW